MTEQEFYITTNPADQRSPAIYGNIVVWEDSRNINLDIYGYDLLRSKEVQITKDQYDQRAPAVYEDVVVWMDKRNGNWENFRKLSQNKV